MINPRIYHRPRTVDEAVKYLNEPNSIVISGGNRLLGGITLPYETIVDLQDLSDFKKIVYDDNGLHIGGSATLQDVIKSDSVLPHVKKAIFRTLPENQRNGISVSESLTIFDPPREWLAALVVLGAEMEHAGYRKGKITAQGSRLALVDFVSELRGYGFPYAGFVTAIHIPVLYERAYLGTAHVSRTPAGIPIVNAAALVQIAEDTTITNIQVAAGGVSELPVMSIMLDDLIGKPLNEMTIAEAAESVRAGVKPTADYQGSIEYRREIVVVTVRRALLDCLAQLNS